MSTKTIKEYWGPDEHGLGKRRIAQEKVEPLEKAVLGAAQQATAIGVDHAAFLELCDFAMNQAMGDALADLFVAYWTEKGLLNPPRNT
jgi:hypothetical protein